MAEAGSVQWAPQMLKIYNVTVVQSRRGWTWLEVRQAEEDAASGIRYSGAHQELGGAS